MNGAQSPTNPLFPFAPSPLRPQAWGLFLGSPKRHRGGPAPTSPIAVGPGWWAVPRGRARTVPERAAGRSDFSVELATSPPVLVVTDADATLLQNEVIDELAARAGQEAKVAAVTAAAMRGEIDFAESLHRRVAALRGLPQSVLGEVRRDLTLTPGAADLIEWTHRVGAKFAVVSGGFEEVLRPLTAALGVDYLAANHLEVRDGHLTGRVQGEVVDSQAKARCAHKWSGDSLARTVAVGDGSNDIPMLTSVGLGIAFCAKSAVREAVPSYLDVPRLDAVIGLLGCDLPIRSLRPHPSIPCTTTSEEAVSGSERG